jgi:ABC-2 type transport system permease protein
MQETVIDNLPSPEKLMEEPLTPREARLERAARGLQLGAALNGIAAALLALIGIGAALFTASGVFTTLHNVLLFRYTGADDAALLTLLMLLMVNASVLLVTMVGVLAQEFWAFVTGVLLLTANIGLLIFLGFTPALLSVLALAWSVSVLLPDLRAFRTNPVMLKELRERMRGARAFAVITVYLGLMSAFSVLLYVAYSPFNRGISSSVTGELGRVLFAGVVGIELVLIIFIAPAFTAGAVTGERERKTYDLLQITLLPRPSFIIGKLESALGYIFLLLLAAIPLQSIAFLFGGVSETELFLSFEILVVTAITLGTIGLFFSTVAERTLTASVRSYTFAFGLIFGLPAALAVIVSILNGFFFTVGGSFNGPPFVEAALTYVTQFLISLNPMTTSLSTQELLINQQRLGFYTHTLSSNGSSIPLASPWISFTIIYLVLSAVMITLAIRRMRRTEL